MLITKVPIAGKFRDLFKLEKPHVRSDIASRVHDRVVVMLGNTIDWKLSFLSRSSQQKNQRLETNEIQLSLIYTRFNARDNSSSNALQHMYKRIRSMWNTS